MKSAKGLHLWDVRIGYSNLWVTTRLLAPQTAVKRAQQVAKNTGERGRFVSIEYKGTIDA